MKKAIYFTKNYKTLYLLIHGYTGSPSDFNGFPKYLHENYKVDVKIPLLVGHGGGIEKLDNISFDDFVRQFKNILKEDRKKYQRIVIGGLSWGAILSLLLASECQVDGVLSVNLPTKLKFPMNIPGLIHVVKYKKYWPKVFEPEYYEKIKDSLDYDQMHVNGLRLVNERKKRLKISLPYITAPIFSLHSIHDKVGSHKSVRLLEKKIKSKHKILLYTENYHNIFNIDNERMLFSAVAKFFEESSMNNNIQKVAAVVPAYNEEKHIADVLSVLSKTEILDEIIVVDDSSSDRTGEIAKSFSEINYIRNQVNSGKAISMQRGVEETDANIIFFCDADLKKLNTEIVTSIVEPVLNKKYDMYIGLRNNVFQKMFKIFALNSGERAVNRELWEAIPTVFKYRYRIEVAMNYYASRHGNGFGSKRFAYYQTIKEEKYGAIRGDFLRWWMYFDVFTAYILIAYYELKYFFNHSLRINNRKYLWRHKH